MKNELLLTVCNYDKDKKGCVLSRVSVAYVTANDICLTAFRYNDTSANATATTHFTYTFQHLTHFSVDVNSDELDINELAGEPGYDQR